MWSSKDVYYISDSTGILASNLGHALLCQFPATNFYEERFPFVRTREQAKKTLGYILKQSAGRRPLIFSTIVKPELRKIFDTPEVEVFDVFAAFLDRLEGCLEAKAIGEPGFSHQAMDERAINRRVEAIQYCLSHDDGFKAHEFDEADVVLVGVSRAGKTPVSVYLATQMGLKAGNFPLTAEQLNEGRLPDTLVRNLKHVVGLATSAEILRAMREKRYPGSNYAKLVTCSQELHQAEAIFRQYRIPVVSSAGKSIEEIATQVSQELGLSKKPETLAPASLPVTPRRDE
ncbi:MAG: pyruvate, phosphate dikinase/phosphoenolpyruvate synthase regulator [Thermodesulfobacteriota bacterium]